MTLDEAIKHCEEVAEENDLAAGMYEILAENNHNAYEKLTAETTSSRCAECATDHRQLAEWLKELKDLREENVELKSTLNAALKDIHGKNILEVMNACRLCAMKFQQLCDIFPWQHTNEALKLIGEDGENDG